MTGGRPPTALLVAGVDGKLTLDGQATTWEQLPALLGKLRAERRSSTRLVLVPASEELTLRQLRDLRARAAEIVKQTGLRDLTVAETEPPAKAKCTPSSWGGAGNRAGLPADIFPPQGVI